MSSISTNWKLWDLLSSAWFGPSWVTNSQNKIPCDRCHSLDQVMSCHEEEPREGSDRFVEACPGQEDWTMEGYSPMSSYHEDNFEDREVVSLNGPSLPWVNSSPDHYSPTSPMYSDISSDKETHIQRSSKHRACQHGPRHLCSQCGRRNWSHHWY